jgi:hypothetical protein
VPDERADSGRYQKSWDDDDLRDLREDLVRLSRRGPTLPPLPEPEPAREQAEPAREQPTSANEQSAPETP